RGEARGQAEVPQEARQVAGDGQARRGHRDGHRRRAGHRGRCRPRRRGCHGNRRGPRGREHARRAASRLRLAVGGVAAGPDARQDRRADLRVPRVRAGDLGPARGDPHVREPPGQAALRRMTSKTTPESPLPIRTVLQMVGGWIGKLGTVWAEGQITGLSARGGTVFLPLRDPVANVSARVTAPRGVYEAAEPRPADGARVVVHVKPDFWVNRGSFAFTALEIRPVGVGELLARLERLRRLLAAEGLFGAERKRRLPFLPGTVGLICGRDSAAERDVLESARRRWPAVRFRVEEVAVQGPYAVAEVTGALERLEA